MRTALMLVVSGLGLALGTWACSDDTGSSPTDYTTLLQTLTANVILPHHDAFAASADALSVSLHDLEAEPTAEGLTKAQTAWRAARVSYRHLDALHFGPIADLGISQRIDLAPADPTAIESLIRASAPVDASTVAKVGGREKGFLGLEYLLFSSKSNVLADVKRRSLIRLMGDELATSAHELADAWAPGKGGYATSITDAGKGSTRYPSQRAALDDIVGGVGYAFELVVGVRLAEPLGRKTGGTPDATQDPTTASDSAAADLKATIGGIDALYADQGLSTRVKIRSTVLDERIAGQIANCITKLEAIPAPFDTALTASTSFVQASYDACKTAKNTWNTDVTSALGATLKPSDNDGD